jgi:outer membrane immunogenic protein
MRAILAASVLALSATAALAQDVNWSGIYVGAHAGYDWADVDFPGLPLPKDGPPRPDLEGPLVGAQAGGNIQLQKFVLGFEADISLAEQSERLYDGNFITQETEIERFGTLRAKVGYAYNRWLPYVTGGAAWGDVSYNETCPDVGNISYTFCSSAPRGNYSDGTPKPYAGPYSNTKSEILWGWTIGAGVQYAVTDRVWLGAEYLHIDFEDEVFELGKSPNGTKISDKPIDLDLDVARLTVNLKLW